MSPSDREKLRQQLILHEGKRKYPYYDTAGHLTIGVGHNIDARGLDPLRKAIARTVTLEQLHKNGLTDEEIDRVLDADLTYFEERVRFYFPNFDVLDPIRQRVMVDFAFNLGRRALGFTKAIEALKKATEIIKWRGVGRRQEMLRLYYTECAFHMMDSLWATQVGDGVGKRYDRAERLSEMMRSGEDYKR